MARTWGSSPRLDAVVPRLLLQRRIERLALEARVGLREPRGLHDLDGYVAATKISRSGGRDRARSAPRSLELLYLNVGGGAAPGTASVARRRITVAPAMPRLVFMERSIERTAAAVPMRPRSHGAWSRALRSTTGTRRSPKVRFPCAPPRRTIREMMRQASWLFLAAAVAGGAIVAPLPAHAQTCVRCSRRRAVRGRDPREGAPM